MNQHALMESAGWTSGPVRDQWADSDVHPAIAAESAVSLDEVLRRDPAESRPSTPVWPLPAVIVGRLAGIATDGGPLVDFEGNPTGRPLPARSTGTVDRAAIGCAVALLFENGDLARPIIVGAIGCGAAVSAAQPAGGTPAPRETPSALRVEATADGERVTLTAEKEIELRCGKAGITLTRAGKVIIRGAYLLSRSSGVNRIKGGSVQIN
jgi:hypothetical protein